MTIEETIKMVQAHKFPKPMEEWQRLNNEAIDMAIEALQNEETLKTQLANCHREILRLLDFSDMTEPTNDDIEPQNDVIEIVRCKDCRYRKKVGTSYYCDLDEFNVKDADFCSWGERREP